MVQWYIEFADFLTRNASACLASGQNFMHSSGGCTSQVGVIDREVSTTISWGNRENDTGLQIHRDFPGREEPLRNQTQTTCELLTPKMATAGFLAHLIADEPESP